MSSGDGEASSPRTVSGKRPSSAALQREREYASWLFELPTPERDDEQVDDSREAFMAAREKARLKQVAERRRKERWRKRGRSPPAQYVDTRAKVQQEWEAYCF